MPAIKPTPFRPLRLELFERRDPQLAQKLSKTMTPGDSFVHEAQVKQLSPQDQAQYAAIAKADKRAAITWGASIIAVPVVAAAGAIATGGMLLPALAAYALGTGGMLASDQLGWPEPRA